MVDPTDACFDCCQEIGISLTDLDIARWLLPAQVLQYDGEVVPLRLQIGQDHLGAGVLKVHRLSGVEQPHCGSIDPRK